MTDNWDLTGHRWAVDLLRRHVANGEARHAYLFAGPPGVGRRSLALRFAQALNCTEPPAPGEYCGKCWECQQIKAMRHPDVMIIESVIKDGTLKIDIVRDAQRIISRTPFRSKYRVSLFPRFQRATIEAQNALLKTLEEAPAHAILILTADEPELLLPTIVSRCEVIGLRAPGMTEVEEMLEREGVGPGEARRAAHIGSGRPGYSRRILQDQELHQARSQQLEDLQALLHSTRAQRFAYADKLAKARCGHKHVEERIVLAKKEEEELQRVKAKCVMRSTLPTWLSFWRDVMLKTSNAAVEIANVDYEPQINELASRLSFEQACGIVKDLEQGIQRLERNVNARLLAEVLLLGWPKL